MFSVIDKRNAKQSSSAQRLNPSKINITKFEKANNELVTAYESEQQTYIVNQIYKIANIFDVAEKKQVSLAFKTVNEITGRMYSSKSPLRAVSQEKRPKLWKEHFQNLLKSPRSNSDRPVETTVKNTLPVSSATSPSTN